MGKWIRRVLLGCGTIAVVLYVSLCIYLHVNQEKYLFRPKRLSVNYFYKFPENFNELNIKATDGTLLNALLFHTDTAMGVILYLHGNAGSLGGWGEMAKPYLDAHQDLLMVDYRGFGKSGGSIKNEQMLYDDAQQVYNELRKNYPENKITLLGFSMGTGIATWLAAHNHPAKLILQAPYYNMTDLMYQHYPKWIPSFILNYKLRTNELLPKVTCPVVIFHGDKDRVINYNSSLRLKTLLKPKDTLIIFHNQGHNGFTENAEYISVLGKVL